MAFTKLDSGITDSTIWQAPDATRIVWITMLAMADKNGYIGASMPGLAGRARVSLEACIAAVATFMAPDEWSRTQDFEGRRIAEAEGGWVLLNHAKYRAAEDAEKRRERSRIAMAKLRERRRTALTVNHGEQSDTELPQADTEAEADTEATQRGAGEIPGDTRKSREPSGFPAAFAAWVLTLPEKARVAVKPTKQRRDKYKARRTEGYTHEQITAAVTAYVHDPWPERLKSARAYDFATLLRDGGQVEKFAAMARSTNGNGHAKEEGPLDGMYTPPGTKRYSRALHAWVPTAEWKPEPGGVNWT